MLLETSPLVLAAQKYLGNEVKAAKVLEYFMDDMDQTMQKSEGAGLAAVQVGVLKRAFVMRAGKDRNLRECINPKILKLCQSKIKPQTQ